MSVESLQKALEQKAKTSLEVWNLVKGDGTYWQTKDKWVSLEETQKDVTAVLMKLVQERDDNKLLVIQAVTKLRAKEEEFDGKVLLDRKQLSDWFKELKDTVEHGMPFDNYIRLKDFNKLCVRFEELLAGSDEALNLALAFSDTKSERRPECVFGEIPVHCLEAIEEEKQKKKKGSIKEESK